ncbi:MAG: hypothetical protein IT445_03160 [Phycisphaeraceae bacterium]|nr:hypothetical protein [Phycisphaeraceae bacterium]
MTPTIRQWIPPGPMRAFLHRRPTTEHFTLTSNAMGIFSRLFGRRDWLEEAEANSAKRDKREARAVQTALSNPNVTEFLHSKGLGADDLQALRSRLIATVPEKDRADRAIADVELLEWFFSLPDPNKITLDESLQLINWVRYGNKP